MKCWYPKSYMQLSPSLETQLTWSPASRHLNWAHLWATSYPNWGILFMEKSEEWEKHISNCACWNNYFKSWLVLFCSIKINTNESERKYATRSGHFKVIYEKIWKVTGHWKWHLDEWKLWYHFLWIKTNLDLRKECLLTLKDNLQHVNQYQADTD